MEGSNSPSLLDSAFYGIQWAHNIAGCVDDPPCGEIYSRGSEKESGKTCKSQLLSLSLVQFLLLHDNKVDASL